MAGTDLMTVIVNFFSFFGTKNFWLSVRKMTGRQEFYVKIISKARILLLGKKYFLTYCSPKQYLKTIFEVLPRGTRVLSL